MRMFITILISILLSISSIAVTADTGYSYNISLCYDGDAYSVDYVFNVPQGTDILSVVVTDADCIYDWNFIKSDARLYVSLASGHAIPKGKTIATIAVSNEKTFLEPVSVTVNGNIKTSVYAYHTEVETPDSPGYTGGTRCQVCGTVLIPPEIVHPTGDIVNAVLSSDGILTVSGVLADKPVVGESTFVAVYDRNKKMIDLKIATVSNQSEFMFELDNMDNAYIVKIFRWKLPDLIPIHDEIAITVKSVNG